MGFSLKLLGLLLIATLASEIAQGERNHIAKTFQAKLKQDARLCAVDQPSKTMTGVSQIRCSAKCSLSADCSHFNYRTNGRICELFQFTPGCYEEQSFCTVYQLDGILPRGTNTGFPAENCSFPFTYEGDLYYSCMRNMFGNCKRGCLVAKRTLQTCAQNIDYVAKNITTNVSIPTFNVPTLLISVNNWIVIQQRIDGSTNFSRNWAAYKAGFGDIYTNFWLGLEKMHQMTSSATTKLRIEIQATADGKWFSAEYDTFLIDSEINGYAVFVTGYCGDAGDGFNDGFNPNFRQNGMKFTTYDMDNDLNSYNCAVLCGGGGFWLNSCLVFNLNQPYGSDFCYNHLVGLGLSTSTRLMTSRMMIRYT